MGREAITCPTNRDVSGGGAGEGEMGREGIRCPTFRDVGKEGEGEMGRDVSVEMPTHIVGLKLQRIGPGLVERKG